MPNSVIWSHKHLSQLFKPTYTSLAISSHMHHSQLSWSCMHLSAINPRMHLYFDRRIHLFWSYGPTYTSLWSSFPTYNPNGHTIPHAHLLVKLIFFPAYTYLGYLASYPLFLVIRSAYTSVGRQLYVRLRRSLPSMHCWQIFVFTHK
jgi:hypothetical protein